MSDFIEVVRVRRRLVRWGLWVVGAAIFVLAVCAQGLLREHSIRRVRASENVLREIDGRFDAKYTISYWSEVYGDRQLNFRSYLGRDWFLQGECPLSGGMFGVRREGAYTFYLARVLEEDVGASPKPDRPRIGNAQFRFGEDEWDRFREMEFDVWRFADYLEESGKRVGDPDLWK